MEDDDFTIDQEGLLELRYRGWTAIDATVFSMVQEIVILDLSFNQMQSLPDEIGLLKQMATFNCSCNALTKVPPSIGRLRRLKELKLNGNKLSTLPNEISDCRKLSKLYLNENGLKQLPDSIGECACLKILYLQNNALHSLPLTLAKLKDSLEVLNLENNPDLSIIPSKMRENSAVSMWIICLLDQHTIMARTIRHTTLEMSVLGQKIREEIEEGRSQLCKLEEEQRDLIEERESVSIFIIAQGWYRIGIIKIQKLKSFRKKMLRRDNSVGIYDANMDGDA